MSLTHSRFVLHVGLLGNMSLHGRKNVDSGEFVGPLIYLLVQDGGKFACDKLEQDKIVCGKLAGETTLFSEVACL